MECKITETLRHCAERTACNVCRREAVSKELGDLACIATTMLEAAGEIDRKDALINELKQRLEQQSARINELAGLPTARLRELIEADRAGRVVVLPDKIETVVHPVKTIPASDLAHYQSTQAKLRKEIETTLKVPAELKSCPFCGSSSVFVDAAHGLFPHSIIHCACCNSIFTLDDGTATSGEVIEAWNRRCDNG